ncbi:hypothetical protein IFO70_20695 [Phormidium tenue FACHB-886]|nr:hypothetical protein [Phormidium tenue FACHB-886]
MLNQLPKFSTAIASFAFGATLIASPVQAAIVTYNFTVNVTEGALAGQSYRGTFSYDDSMLKGTGAETLGVDQGLTVCMNYFGQNYTAANDRDYPNFPKLAFENGEIEYLDFWVQPNDRVVWWNLPGWEVDLSLRQSEADTVNCQE